MGFVTLGIFTFTVFGFLGAMLQMLNHGITTGALFLMVGIIYERTHSRQIFDNAGLGKFLPAYVGFFGLFACSSFAFPGTNSFVGELYVLIGTFAKSKTAGFFAVVGAVVAAAYMLNLLKQIVWGRDGQAGPGGPEPPRVHHPGAAGRLRDLGGALPRPLREGDGDHPGPSLHATEQTIPLRGWPYDAASRTFDTRLFRHLPLPVAGKEEDVALHRGAGFRPGGFRHNSVRSGCAGRALLRGLPGGLLLADLQGAPRGGLLPRRLHVREGQRGRKPPRVLHVPRVLHPGADAPGELGGADLDRRQPGDLLLQPLRDRPAPPRPDADPARGVGEVPLLRRHLHGDHALRHGLPLRGDALHVPRGDHGPLAAPALQADGNPGGDPHHDGLLLQAVALPAPFLGARHLRRGLRRDHDLHRHGPQDRRHGAPHPDRDARHPCAPAAGPGDHHPGRPVDDPREPRGARPEGPEDGSSPIRGSPTPAT